MLCLKWDWQDKCYELMFVSRLSHIPTHFRAKWKISLTSRQSQLQYSPHRQNSKWYSPVRHNDLLKDSPPPLSDLSHDEPHQGAEDAHHQLRHAQHLNHAELYHWHGLLCAVGHGVSHPLDEDWRAGSPHPSGQGSLPDHQRPQVKVIHNRHLKVIAYCFNIGQIISK